MVKHVESHEIQPHIGVPSLVCDVFSVQKKEIGSQVTKIGDSPSVLSMSYTVIVGKHVVDIVMFIDEIILVVVEEMLYVASSLGPIRSHILKGFESCETYSHHI